MSPARSFLCCLLMLVTSIARPAAAQNCTLLDETVIPHGTGAWLEAPCGPSLCMSGTWLVPVCDAPCDFMGKEIPSGSTVPTGCGSAFCEHGILTSHEPVCDAPCEFMGKEIPSGSIIPVGDFTLTCLHAEWFTSPSLDALSAPGAISGEGSWPWGSDATATSYPPALGGGGGEVAFDEDVWFSWTPPQSGVYLVSTCVMELAEHDTSLAVYADANAVLQGIVLASSDDDCGSTGKLAELSFPAEAGHSYLVRVGDGVLLVPGLETLDVDPLDHGWLTIARIGDVWPWTDEGHALAGTGGTPHLTGSGPLVGGTVIDVELIDAPPSTLAMLVLGYSQLGLPLYGGTLVPTLDELIPFPTDETGETAIQTSWPTGVAPGLEFFLQYWIRSPSGPVGWVASNSVRAETP